MTALPGTESLAGDGGYRLAANDPVEAEVSSDPELASGKGRVATVRRSTLADCSIRVGAAMLSAVLTLLLADNLGSAAASRSTAPLV
jgi:hypothetical protein